MCLYPKLVLNPKYLPNKKNKGNGMPIQPGQGMAYGGRMNYTYAGYRDCTH